ncbi:prolyl oligopeptidase family serine peptidase [Antarcticirhabdus aurantiaca]|uniref:Prolyl oligopeptidase family serine peptidase n=1 Tax=Antarcticirhabdus aurantiaca TaxID=2606717 RepID=A0ACD4NH47_9HYPH|nr:prolyl oligopeptidase family serine peptidase [Jeongeuplla avenae]
MIPTRRARLSGLGPDARRAAGERSPHARTAPARLAGRASALCLSLLLGALPASANEDMPMIYPDTKRVDVVDHLFGVDVADPYRWLETDWRRDAEVARWVDAQDKLARSYLAGLPECDAFATRLAALFDHEQFGVPEKRGGRYFSPRLAGLEAQATLVMREGVNGRDRVILDPNRWSKKGDVALAEWAVSQDGSHVAFAMQEGGSDWRRIRILDVDGEAFLDDELARVRFTTIAWARDGSGFFYARFPDAAADEGFETPVAGHAVYFHRLGTPQAEDRLLFETPDRPNLLNIVCVTEDGRYATVSSMPGAGGNALAIVDLEDPAWTPRVLVAETTNAWALVGNVGTKLFLSTQKGAERGKIVTLDLADPDGRFEDLIPEGDAALREAVLIGGRLVLSTIVDARMRIERFRLDGTPDGTVELPGIGSAGGFTGRADDAEAFFVFTSHDAPTTILRYDVAKNAATVWAEPKVEADLDAIEVEQRFFASTDGTRVPLFLVRRKDVADPAPTLLYGYGGYGISMTPFFSPATIAWVEQGGVYAVANIRGGGEYGKAWHDAGRMANKQNVFDDFIAAGEYLKSEGITAPGGLAIQGESNGGLLVGAVVNQRPDLFAAALPGVGVMDMLRFDRFTGGQFWRQDYGDPGQEADFRNLLSYSPLHTIAPGRNYPAILTLTADTDDRVVPGHSFKYAATLQAADLGDRPRLLRVDRQVGHGAGMPTGKAVDQLADMLAFAARWTGLTVEAPR